ncbi:hypothetical protein SDC9_131585 [bioreactor metagenome]|uniref:Uncharacterized protein n=1 Tax=bioreactor metagenome TaxID=1076179 RepID=A0A645D7A9_9ZZZZ
MCREGYTIEEARHILESGEKLPIQKQKGPTIGLLGYVYNIYDSYISMDIIKRLRNMGVNVVTFEMFDEKEIENRGKGKGVFWSFARKLYNAGNRMLEDEKIDGIIHLTAFACGPDSVIGKLLEGDCAKGRKPFMTIRVDEHTGEGHVQTRIEAFVDMLNRKKTAVKEVI